MSNRDESLTEHQKKWYAMTSLGFYFALISGLLFGSIIIEVFLLSLKLDYTSLPFPLAFIALPINETIFFGLTIFFIKYKRASVRDLGIKHLNPKTLLLIGVALVGLLGIVTIVAGVQQTVFGPDPTNETLLIALLPQNIYQLVGILILNLVLVGPVEELAFRGFMQQGFENSFGKIKGLIITAGLFGLLHGFNSLYSISGTLVAGLVLGYIWQKTGRNTLATAILHGLYNVIIIGLTYFLTV